MGGMGAMMGEVGSKLNSAKTFVSEQAQNVTSAVPIQAIKDKVGSVVGATPVGNYLSGFSNGFGGSSSNTGGDASTWTKHFPSAKGVRQSPIDIRPNDALFDPTLQSAQMRFNYNAQDLSMLRNVGSTWQVSVTPDATSSFGASFLPDEYRLLQVHAHWGSEAHDGSEHLIGGLGYAAELHIIHWNKKYGSPEEAAKHGDGFLVLAVFLDEGIHNDGIDGLAKVMHQIAYKDDEVQLRQGLDLRSLIPATPENFYTYEGSLTQAPYTECVHWLVFRGTISVGPQQLAKFRSLHAVAVEDAERNPQRIVKNVRECQPLNNRQIRTSYQKP